MLYVIVTVCCVSPVMIAQSDWPMGRLSYAARHGFAQTSSSLIYEKRLIREPIFRDAEVAFDKEN